MTSPFLARLLSTYRFCSRFGDLVNMLPPSVPAPAPGSSEEFQWLMAAIQTAHVPVTISRLRDGRFVEVNEAFLEMSGYMRGEVIGYSSLDLGLWVDPVVRKSMVDWLSNGGTVTNFEMHFRTKSGEIGDMLVSSRMIKINGDAYLISFVTDITGLRREEKLAYVARLRLEAVLASQSQIVFHQDADLRYTWIANPGFGYTEAEVVGRNDEEIFGFKTAAPLVELKGRVLVTGQAERKEVWLTHNGETKGFELTVLPERDSGGCVTGLICAAMDITKPRNEVEALGTTLGSIADGFVSLDKNWRFTYMNDVGANLLKLRRDDVLGKEMYEVLDDIKDTPLETFLQQSAKGSYREFENFYAPLQRWFSARCYPRNDGGISVFFSDITEEKIRQIRLAESESRLSAFIEHAPVAMIMLDENLRCLEVSRQWLEYYGVSGQDFRGLPFYEMFPDFPERWKFDHRQVLEGKTVMCDEDKLELKDGCIKWVQRELRPWYRAGGEIGGIIIFHADISARKEAERKAAAAESELRQTVERLRFAMDATNEAIWDWNLMTGEVFYSAAYYTMLDYEIGELAPTVSTWTGLLHPDEAERVAAEALRLLHEPGYYALEFRMRKASGDYCWVVSHGRVVERDAEGKPTRAVGTHIDITEQRLLEDSLKLSESRLYSIVEGTSDAVYIKDLQGRYVLANSATARFVGKKIEEILGQDDTSWFPPEEATVVMQKDQAVLRGGTAETLVERVTTADGVLRTFFTTKGPVLDSERNSIGLFGIARDITELRRAETEYLESLKDAKIAAESANLAKSRFLANMSHEMRTPLGHIAGMSMLIRRDSLSEKQTAYLDTLDGACEHLTFLIERILNLTLFVSGNLVIAEEPLDLREAVSPIISRAHSKASKKQISVHIEDIPDKKGLQGDAHLIQQALDNVVSNAVRFTHEGIIQIRTKIVEENQESVLVRFEVRDSGEGIKPEDQSRLFSDFEQVDNSSTRRYDGLGIGLALTRRIAEVLGGEAGCESSYGVGSVFWFTVRLKKVNA